MKIPIIKISLKAAAGVLLALGLFAFEAGAQQGPQGKVPPQLPPQANDKAKGAVAVQTAPTVSLTAPAGGALYTAPATVPLTSSATASSGGKFIVQVEFFAGATLIGTTSSAPYAFTWTPVAAGAYSLTARATDNLGVAATSSAIAITVNAPPTVSLTSPGDATVLNAPATILLTAAAADPDGTIAQVEFYSGTSLIAALSAPPYSINWLEVPQGSYSLSARVTDNLGATTTSTAVTVTVNTALAQIYYIHTDHLNTPRAIYDQQQRLVWRWDQTDPFGGNPPNENPSGLGNFTCNLRLPGQYFDKETNLHFNYFRDYDPAIGRYIQSDPIGLEGDINTYAYAYNNPLSFFDPNGLEVQIKCRDLGFGGPTISKQLFGKPQRHCFVYVTCPDEGWRVVLSMQGNLWPLPIFSSGRKVQASPFAPVEGDDPFSANMQTIPIAPKKPQCGACTYEKDVYRRFVAVPFGNLHYDELGANSNTFVNYLITSPAFGVTVPYNEIPNALGLSGSPPSSWVRR